jgi:hypothetical protein
MNTGSALLRPLPLVPAPQQQQQQQQPNVWQTVTGSGLPASCTGQSAAYARAEQQQEVGQGQGQQQEERQQGQLQEQPQQQPKDQGGRQQPAPQEPSRPPRQRRGIDLVQDQAGLDGLASALTSAGRLGWALHLHSDHQQQEVHSRLPAQGSGGRAAGAAAAAATAAAAAAAAAPASWPWEVYGVAFSCGDGAAWYVPLYKCGSTRRLLVLWEGVRALLERPGLVKVGFAVKHQLKLLQAPPPLALLAKFIADSKARSGGGVGGAAGGGEGGGALGPAGAAGAAGAEGELSPVAVADPVVDARVCAWLVQPGDYSWECKSRGTTGLDSTTAALRKLLASKAEAGDEVGGHASGAATCDLPARARKLRRQGVTGPCASMSDGSSCGTTPSHASAGTAVEPSRFSLLHNVRWHPPCRRWRPRRPG